MLIQNLGVFSAYAEVFLKFERVEDLKEYLTQVFSAYAEVFLKGTTMKNNEFSFLRVRGGVSCILCTIRTNKKFSPRTRRCFCFVYRRHERTGVFSAYAEVFPCGPACRLPGCRFLRVRGGVSNSDNVPTRRSVFSPRTRRCFRHLRHSRHRAVVFSAYAEVFPLRELEYFAGERFLRVRGGVSKVLGSPIPREPFSPRTRRCFF